jgi:hypothetical protein
MLLLADLWTVHYAYSLWHSLEGMQERILRIQRPPVLVQEQHFLNLNT